MTDSSYHASVPDPVALSERQLLDGLRRGDRRSAEVLLERSYRAIWRTLYRMTGDTDAAADLTQDTYRKAWESIASFDGRSSFGTWLHKIAYTTFLNSIRRPRLVVPLEPAVSDSARTDEPSPEDAASIGQRDTSLRTAVLALPEELRLVVTAHYWMELSVREIAQMAGITQMGVRKRLKRAHALLLSDMGDPE